MLLALSWQSAFSASRPEMLKFQSEITDYRTHLNPRFKKVVRKQTRYIIIHTSELGRDATLRVIAKGKQLPGGRTTPGGHAHYVIARDGKTYRTLDKEFRADHAGLSLWQNQQDISSVSVGIELVGYHYAPLTDAQYRSVRLLLRTLLNSYGLPDTAVLTHSQVAYGRPNRWFPKDHRGRKRCAKNFDRTQAGLGPTLSQDPDVASGRLMPDPQLAEVFYGRPRPGSQPAVAAVTKLAPPRAASNIISKENSAWSIAGEDFESPATAYFLPDGRILTGDRIRESIGWHLVPVNTRVVLNHVPTGEPTAPLPRDRDTTVKVITSTLTAWSHAGSAYQADTTIYFLPSGDIRTGSGISDWDDLPDRTRLIIGYHGPFPVSTTRTPFRIAGHQYRDPRIVYYLPPGLVRTGDEMTDFSALPRGTLIYLPVDSSG